MSAVAFNRIAKDYAAPLMRLTGGYANSRPDREDLFQEILISIWHALPGFRGDCSERTWVYRIAHNVAISFSLRKHRRREREHTLEDQPDPRSATEANYVDLERHERLAAAVQALEGSDKQIALLYLEGFRNGEIAEVVGLSEGAVATRLSRIRSRLTEIVGARAHK